MSTFIEYDGTKYAVPFVDLLPPLKKSERLDLEASLKAGVDPAYPVEVYDSPTHGPNTVIDGANRLRLCSAHRLTGLAFVRSEITDDEEARRHAIDVNSARRQMDTEAIQAARSERVQRVAEARAEGKSLRTIAEQEGVSPEQVRKDVKAATVKGLTVEPEKVKGRDGKVRTAKPKRKKPEPVNQPADPEPVKETPVQTKRKDRPDDDPEPDARFMAHAPEAVEYADKFRNWKARLESVRAEFKKTFPDRKHVMAKRVDAAKWDVALGELIQTIDENIPECVCPPCYGQGIDPEKGGGCKYCDGYGIVDKGHHSGLKGRWKRTRDKFDDLVRQADSGSKY